MNRFLRAYVLFTGSVIGVGFFGIPYVVVRAGLVPTLLLSVVVLGLVWITHIAFLDIILRTKGKRRLPGYIGMILGPLWKTIAAVANLFGLASALLAYLIIGGTFLALIVAPWLPLSLFSAVLAYLLVAVLLLFWRRQGLFPVQVGILLLFLFTLGLLWAGAGSQVNLQALPLFGALRSLFLPYGVLLFSFWSLSLMPELVELMHRKRDDVRRVLHAGFFTAAVTYGLFTLLIAGVAGQLTSQDAFTGLALFVGRPLIVIGAIFGILTTLDSFLALGMTFAKTLRFDFSVSRVIAWAAVPAVPIALFLLGVQKLVTIMSVTGAVFLGIEGVLVLFAMLYTQRKNTLRMSFARPSVSIAILLLLAGVIAEVLHIFRVF